MPTSTLNGTQLGSSEPLQVVGIGEGVVSTDPRETLVTYSLGSCLGVVLLDRGHGVAGLAHCLLPLSRTDPEKSIESPFLFVDTAMVELVRQMVAKGASLGSMVAWLAGASCILDDGGFFRIGKRNAEVARLFFQKNSIPIVRERVDGTVPRTLRCRVGDGAVSVREGRNEVVL